MSEANVLNIEGTEVKQVKLPAAFSEKVRVDLIRRAVLAERSALLQPQGHFVLAGMQTTATYYGKMNSYRSGRHMGQAVRPKEKLGGGRQGKVRRIPSSVTGKRAHPHQVEKKIIELINKREYSKAVASAVAATSSTAFAARHAKGVKLPVVFSNEIEAVSGTKEFVKIIGAAKLDHAIKGNSARTDSGKRHMSRARSYRKSILVVVGEDKGIKKAARNVAGVDVCTVSELRAELLAPGGNPGRLTVWSEHALEKCDESISKLRVV